MTDLIVKLSSTFLDITPEVVRFSDLTGPFAVVSKITYNGVLFFAVATMVLSLIVAYRCLTCFAYHADDFTDALFRASKIGFVAGCVFTVELILVTEKLPYAMNYLVPALFCFIGAWTLKNSVGI